ncbi:MAG: hypothetical protein AAGC60_17335 [Acidobacteriota bacterium]
MPHRIRYNFENVTHGLAYNNGLVSWNPGFPQSSRLYVIYNNDTNRPYYIGTALNLRNRFNPRATVCRELGFPTVNAMNSVSAYRLQMEWRANGVGQNWVNATPGDNGVVGLIDAEHLLIRVYIENENVGVRNIQKVNAFTNTTGNQLNVYFTDVGNIAALHLPDNFILANNAQL